MAGALAIVAALLVFPVLFLMSMTAVAALLGVTLQDDADARHAGSELVDLNT